MKLVYLNVFILLFLVTNRNHVNCFNITALIENIPKPSVWSQFISWIWGSPATLTINSLDTSQTKSGFPHLVSLFSKKTDVIEINPFWGKYSLAVPLTGLEGIVVKSEPLDACDDIEPPPKYPTKEELLLESEDNSTQKHWFLVADDSGDCSIETKIQNADNAGYNLIIIVNTNSSEAISNPNEDSSENSTSTESSEDAKYNSFLNYIRELFGIHDHKEEPHLITILSCSVGKEDGLLLEDVFAYPEPFTATLMDLRKLNLPKAIFKIFGVSAGAVVVVAVVAFASYKAIKRWVLPSPPPSIQEDDDYGNQCLICNEDFTDTDDIRILPGCLHRFHYKCLKTKTVKNHVHCPICDKSIKVPAIGKQTRFSLPYIEPIVTEKTPLLTSGSFEKPKFHCKICEILATPTHTADNSRTSSPTFRHSPYLTRTMSEQIDSKNIQKAYVAIPPKLIDTKEVIEDEEIDAEPQPKTYVTETEFIFD